MLTILSRIFVRDRENTGEAAVRAAWGALCGALGVALNLLLFALKLSVGLRSGSIAITADAMNNVSDAGSSAVTLLGFRLSVQAPDRDHPFGHGRMEYVSGLLVSMVVVLMGFELFKSSVGGILAPAETDFRLPAALVLLASIAVKCYMALYNRAVGKRIGSAAVRAAAADSLSDCLATGTVLLGGLAGRYWGVPLDGWCGALVSLFILWSGLRSGKETVDELLGRPPSAEFVARVRELVLRRPEIVGVHDLIVHDYGPGRRIISLHAEVPADGDLVELHDVVDAAERELSDVCGCVATIHMDPVVTGDGPAAEARERVEALAAGIDPGITVHDFRMVPGPTRTKLIFDALVPYGCALTEDEVERRLCAGVREMDGRFFAVVKAERGYL